MLSLVPSVSASHYPLCSTKRPSFISIGDIDCDDDNDIVSASSMGHFIQHCTMMVMEDLEIIGRLHIKQ